MQPYDYNDHNNFYRNQMYYLNKMSKKTPEDLLFFLKSANVKTPGTFGFKKSFLQMNDNECPNDDETHIWHKISANGTTSWFNASRR